MQVSALARKAAGGASEADAPATPESSALGSARLDALYLLNCLHVGGSERKIVRLVNQLRQRGTRAAIAYLNEPESLAPLLREDVPRWKLDRRGKFSLPALRRLAALVEAHRPRIVLAVNLYPALYAAALPLVLRTPVHLAALVNTTEFASGERWRKAFYRRVLRRFDTVVYGCESQRAGWIDGADRSWPRSTVVYNGVDLQEFGTAPAAALRTGHRPFVFGSMGRLVTEKNQSVLIDALATLRREGVDARLILVGAGPLREALERQAAEHGVTDALELTGVITDIRPILARMDVFVLPSLYVETFSNAALEAMASAKPVILSEIGGAREMVRDGVDGFVVPRPALPQELPRLLRQLAADESLRARLGGAARRRVESNFSLQTMVERYEQLIGQVGHGNGR